jgi:hypothetical protein
MRNGAFLKMFNEDAHFGVVAEASFLLIKTEMSRVQVDDEGGRAAFELLENMRLAGNCSQGMSIWS